MGPFDIQADIDEYAMYLKNALNMRLAQEYSLLHPDEPWIWIDNINVTIAIPEKRRNELCRLLNSLQGLICRILSADH